MGDDENDETFESTDAGSSHTYPMEGGQIRKGGYIMIKQRPCKVSDVSTSKTGKHGHAKCHFVAIDIFTGKKMEDLVPASHTTSVPFVKKEEYQCLDADEDGFVTVMTAGGDTRADLKLPSEMQPEPPGAMELSNKIRELLAAEKDFYVIVQQACGTEQIMDTKVMTN
jgi:translation initiation factor 5A